MNKLLNTLEALRIPGIATYGVLDMDDAAIHVLDDEKCLVTSLDFGTPVSSDPYVWGRVACLHALSDIYAMGATPIGALSILGLPSSVDEDMTNHVLRGARDALIEASSLLMGGHTVRMPIPIFGLSVIGTAVSNQIMWSYNCQPGQKLILTKPIGTGIVISARKAGLASLAAVESAEGVMSSSNRAAAERAVQAGIRAATDVSGYGLVGHLHAMLKASLCAAILDVAAVPVLEQALLLVEGDAVVPNNAENTMFELEQYVDWRDTPLALRFVFTDPQTSGGLLLAAEPQQVSALEAFGTVIGAVTEGAPGTISCVGSRL